MNETAALTLDSMIARTQGLLDSNLGEEVVMMSIEKGNYYGLDPIGSLIWQALETPLRVAAVCERLLPNYDVPREQGEADILTFLHDLLSHEIIRVVDPTELPEFPDPPKLPELR